ncbi:MAG: GDSL-type esterase/lipase family protein [Bacteroidota bacterium]
MKSIFRPLSLILNIVLIGYIFLKESSFANDGDEKIKEMAVIKKNGVTDEKGLFVNPVNIVMLGNSITYQGNWQEVLKRKDVFNGGKPGWTTQQLSWVIKDFIVPHKPELCFFKGGINDYTLGISTQRIYQNMTMVLDSINALGTKPVYTSTLYQRTNFFRNRQIDSLNQMMQQFCQDKGYDFMDLRPYLCQEGDILEAYVLPDHTHLIPEAYPQWARAMELIFQKYGL